MFSSVSSVVITSLIWVNYAERDDVSNNFFSVCLGFFNAAPMSLNNTALGGTQTWRLLMSSHCALDGGGGVFARLKPRMGAGCA